MIRTRPSVRAFTFSESARMQQLYANVLCAFVRDLTAFELSTANLKDHAQVLVGEGDRKMVEEIQATANNAATFFYLPAVAARNERLTAALNQGCLYGELQTQLRVLREALEDELKDRLVLYMPAGQAVHFYAGGLLLGEVVANRFPQLGYDIDEAGKCMGSGRTTAAVFHLMRILEVGVQEFGAALGVAFTDAKNWHNILEESDKAIKGLDKNQPGRSALAEISALLGAVKLAWRNEVMHPKASYDAEEADNVLATTKAFMAKLAKLLTPPP